MSIKNTKNLEGKKIYEIAFLLKDPASEKVILDLLSENKAVISNQSPINSIKLAYPIKKHTSAYFGYINFEADPTNIKSVSETLNLNPEVLRFLIITSPVISKKSESDKYSEAKKSSKLESGNGTVLTNEALEEKLEEILK